MSSYLIHYGTANSGRFKKGSTGNTQDSREALYKNNKKVKGSQRTQNIMSKKGNSKLSQISNEDYQKFQKVAQDVIRGKYGNGQARKDAMKKAGYSYDKVQNIVNNKLIGTKLNFSVSGQQKTTGTRTQKTTTRRRRTTSSRRYRSYNVRTKGGKQ